MTFHDLISTIATVWLYCFLIFTVIDGIVRLFYEIGSSYESDYRK